MNILERRFSINYMNGVMWKSDKTEIRAKWIDALFEIPDVPFIWLSLHDGPARERIKLRILSSGSPWLIDHVLIDELCTKTYGTPELHNLIHPYVGKTLYLQCEYEE